MLPRSRFFFVATFFPQRMEEKINIFGSFVDNRFLSFQLFRAWMKIHKQWRKLFLLSARRWIEETRRIDRDKEQFSVQNWLRWFFGKVLWHFLNFSHFRIFFCCSWNRNEKVKRTKFFDASFSMWKISKNYSSLRGNRHKISEKKSVKILTFIGRKKSYF